MATERLAIGLDNPAFVGRVRYQGKRADYSLGAMGLARKKAAQRVVPPKAESWLVCHDHDLTIRDILCTKYLLRLANHTSQSQWKSALLCKIRIFQVIKDSRSSRHQVAVEKKWTHLRQGTNLRYKNNYTKKLARSFLKSTRALRVKLNIGQKIFAPAPN